MTKQEIIKKLKDSFLNKRKGISITILIFSLISIFTLAGFAIDYGLVLNSKYELQKALDAAALDAISEYNAYETGGIIRYPTAANINNLATYNLTGFIKSNSMLMTSKNFSFSSTFGGTIQSRYSRSIRLDAQLSIRTLFLSLINIKKITYQATAVAMNAPLFLKNGCIVNGAAAYSDTEIRIPAGGAPAGAVTINTIGYTLPATPNINANINNIYGIRDGRAVSLGPGGFVTIKLPETLVDKRGFDFAIFESGNQEGYFVFAGNDADPANPYISANSPGGGIVWANISCTGTPIGTVTNGRKNAYRQLIGANFYTKMYGSAYFDIGASCSDGYNANVKSAKYLKIIDDNIEDGFVVRNPQINVTMLSIPVFLPGENSSLTPGADIDAVMLEHHPRLITTNDFNLDFDNDGLINVFEATYSLNPIGSSDGEPTNTDALKFWGYTGNGITNIIIDNPSSTLREGYPHTYLNPPVMRVNY